MNNEMIARSKRVLSVKEFKTAGKPIKIGKIDLSVPDEYIYILRMAIKVEGSKTLLPENLKWLKPMLNEAQEHQKTLELNHPFCYVTIRSGFVISKTDDEWHVDGFSTKIEHNPEQNYIWIDKSPTEFVDLKVDFPSDFNPLKHNVNNYLENFVREDSIEKLDEGTIYCLDPYILHRRPPYTKKTRRTFIRISFVPIEINDINNTQNEILKRIYKNDGVLIRNQLTRY